MNIIYHIGNYFILLSKVFARPEKGNIYYRQIIREIMSLGVASIGIVVIISTFMGAVITLQTAYNTENPMFPTYLIGLGCRDSIILEFSSTMVALILAGKVGSNIASELGTMRVTEQIDALETLAYDPVAYLVVPRVLAGLLMFPVVVILATSVGIAAGWATSLHLLDMSTPEFMKGLRLFFEPWDVQFATIKSLSFGLTVTSIGCFFGFTTTGGAEGVGNSTTRAVVVSSMVLLVLDAFWARVLL